VPLEHKTSFKIRFVLLQCSYCFVEEKSKRKNNIPTYPRNPHPTSSFLKKINKLFFHIVIPVGNSDT